MQSQPYPSYEAWPRLPLSAWQDTYATLHMYTQVIGKIRLELMPWINHTWQTTLYVTARGLTTAPIPYGTLLFQIDFDFIDHYLRIQTSNGGGHALRLTPPLSVADFYWETMEALRSLGIEVTIWTMPQEVPNPIPFEQDQQHASYDPEYVNRCWRILAQSARVFTAFRGRFIGKVSPVHFFWGSFDLAVSRFSGRPAPKHGSVPNIADSVVQDAYSHEVSSAGFWPGGGEVTDPVFYAYAYPSPDGFAEASIQPKEAFYSPQMGEFLLPYEAVRTSDSPYETLLAFLQSTYEAAANLGHWDRAALEKQPSPLNRP